MKQLKFKEKLAYGIGYLGMGLENSFVLGYLTFFATDVLYIKAAIIGIVILLPKVLDILTDIIVMHFVDRTDTRWGKFKPWILSGIPLSICLAFIFLCPGFLSTPTQHLLWITVIYFIMTPIFETMYYCPYLTMGTVISSEENDRVDLASFRSVFEQLSGLIVVCTCMPLVMKFGTDYHDPRGWRILAVGYGLLGIVFTLICFFGVKERVKVNNNNANGKAMSLREKFSGLKHNKPFFKIILIFILLYLPWYSYSTLFNYFCIYVLGHEDWVALLSLVGICIAVLAAVLASGLCKKYERRQVIAVGAILMLASAVVFMFVKSFASMIVFFVLKDIGLVFIYVCTIAYMPDLADFTKYKSKLDITGLVNALVSAFGKLAAAAAAYLATTILSVGRYDATLAVQSDFTKASLRWGVVITFFITSIAIFVINHFLRELDRDRLSEYKTVSDEVQGVEQK